MTSTNQFLVTETVNTLVIFIFFLYLTVLEPHSCHPQYFEKKFKFSLQA